MKSQVVCLVGSTKFKKEFMDVNESLTMQGFNVLSVGVFGHHDEVYISETRKKMLDKLHKEKIDMCEIVVVVNVNDYVGESTLQEISYSLEHGKTVTYFYPRKIQD